MLLPHKIISKKNFQNFSRLTSKRKYGKQKLFQIKKEFGLPIKGTLKKTFKREKTEIYRGLSKIIIAQTSEIQACMDTMTCFSSLSTGTC